MVGGNELRRGVHLPDGANATPTFAALSPEWAGLAGCIEMSCSGLMSICQSSRWPVAGYGFAINTTGFWPERRNDAFAIVAVREGQCVE